MSGNAWFDESRLDSESVLGVIDPHLRWLAESGARVRREAGAGSLASAAIAEGLARSAGQRPRAVIAAGPDSRLLRAVLEPTCPVPFVAWPAPALPGWAGPLDLVVMLAPNGSEATAASAVAEAVRRGCTVVVACPIDSMVAEHAAGRDTTLLPTATGDTFATAVAVLEYLDGASLGPRANADEVAQALDDVAIACSPHRDLSVNPAKMLAIALADSTAILWGGSPLAARAARRIAEAIRRTTGRPALAGDAEHLLPVLEATAPRDVFADPFADEAREPRPVLVVLEDGATDAVSREQRGRLLATADSRGVRVETLTAESPSEVANYASLLLSGSYAASYLQVGATTE